MIKDNLRHLAERIAAASARVKRDPAKIKLVAVTKGRSSAEIREALQAGVTDIGENRVQEALEKYKELLSANLAAANIKWHLVGHLQTNKAKVAVGIFDLIHSVDSLRLAQEIDKQAGRINKRQDILLEVNVAAEATKFGVRPEELPGLVREISGLKQLKVLGLMTVAPAADNPESSRQYFAALRNLRDRINASWILSMGMSDDFEIAIAEGAEMIRLGRAIFGGL